MGDLRDRTALPVDEEVVLPGRGDILDPRDPLPAARIVDPWLTAHRDLELREVLEPSVVTDVDDDDVDGGSAVAQRAGDRRIDVRVGL